MGQGLWVTALENTEDEEYADDACLLAEGIPRIMELTAMLAKASGKLSLKINFRKTKNMVVAKKL